MSDNIKVVVKVRPLISRELDDKLSYQWRIKNNTLYQVDQSGKDCGPCFTFDQVYDKDTKTCDIYNDIAKPIVEAATAGFNGTIFAYGQTSSGKTYTMTGTEVSPGIIPLAVYNLFQIIKNIPGRDFLVRVSYIEIYNETLKDLLSEKKNVKVQETLQGLKMDCKEQVTTSPEEVLKYLKEGDANRQTGATNMNEESSRSHSIFQITIESREHIEGEAEAGCVNVSQLNLVDLAGSERAGQTGATGLRFKEGTHINKSLSTLALVIKQLSEDQQKFVNYRDSKLTRILQNSLGGNAKTSIICAVTPAAVEETISTLQFANRAKAIKNKPEVNAVATDATMIQSLTKQLSRLQSQLETKKNLEVMLEDKKNVEHHLQSKIAALQRLILNGFGARSSLELAGQRRKLVPPRRVTISTLHPIEESPVPSVPKFHTPSLKYNSMITPGSSDFIPIQKTSELLSCVPEEGDIRLITPPPQDKKVDDYSDEIIDLDSDNDSSTADGPSCSPYHKCYGASKTPPCVLRKNAKLAERNLKDIVELTEREKIYPPKEVELIERLEQNTAVITRLEEEVNALNKISKEKDLEINHLKVKVTKSNEEIKSVNSAKADLEALCKEYTTELTDWEVSFDTLKAKTKRREDELLSLLEEHKLHKRVEETSKLIVKNLEKDLNFMDMSKDISLVNSDNESSLTNIKDDETPSQRQDLVENIQNQLTSKNPNVSESEGDHISQKQNILSLENYCHELQQNIDNFKKKVMLLEYENSLLKASIDTLNSTIQSQKSNLEIANNDIDSYNSVIQELHIKLSDRDKLSKSEITDNILENMIANEEKFIANNENMRNIIHCFKIALDTRNKEIESLKCVADQNSSTDMNLKEQLSHKEKEVAELNEKVTCFQSQIDENIGLIDKLMQEKTNFTQIEHQLANKLSDITNQVNQLEKDNKEKDIQIDSMKENIDRLTNAVNTRNKEIESLKCVADQNSSTDMNLKEQLSHKEKEVAELNEKVTCLQSQIDENIGLIDKLMQEKRNFTQIEHQLTNKLSDITNQVNQLEKSNKEKDIQIDSMKENSDRLINAVNEKDATAHELSNENNDMSSKISELDQIILSLKKEIGVKDKLIVSLNAHDTQTQEYLFSANSVLLLLHNIISKLTGNSQELPNTASDNLNDAFDSLKVKLNRLELTLTDIIAHKDLEIEKYVQLSNEVEKRNNMLTTQVIELKSNIEAFNKAEHEHNLLKHDLMEQINSLVRERDNIKEYVDMKNQELFDLAKSLTNLNDIKENNKSLQDEMLSKDGTILSLQKKENKLVEEIDRLIQEQIQSSNDFRIQILNLTRDFETKENNLKCLILEKQTKIDETNTIQLELERKLHESSAEIDNLKEKLRQSEENTYTLLNNILKQTSMVISSLNFECIPEGQLSAYDNIISALNSISNYAMQLNARSIKEDRNTEEELLRNQETMKSLLDQNNDLLENFSEIVITNKTLRSEIEEIRQENRVLNENFAKVSELLSTLKIELSRKSNELENAVVKTHELKDHFIGLDVIIKQEIKDLQGHDEILMARCSKLETNLAAEENYIEIQNIDNENSLLPQSLCDTIKIVENNCPPTLLTICCNKIVETIQPNEKSVSPSESNTTISVSNKETQSKSCDCDILLPELRSAEIENMRLSQLVKNLEAKNCDLISEQEQVRHEVQLLFEPAFELQKKINKHKTNLSTLTATTYAENKSLRSQVKVLQHHHTRFHNVCHRDLPVFRKQLIDLMTILKEDKSYFDTHNSSFKRYSLPSVLLEHSSTINNIKNESTFDGDLLMLDTNLTLATSADNTLMGLDHTCLDMTQAGSNNEIGCQTHISACEDIHHPDLTQLKILSNENRKLYEKIQILEQENQQLGQQAYDYTVMKESLKDAQSSPIKNYADLPTCEYCENLNLKQDSLENEIKLLSQKLNDVETQKRDIENKYKNLSLEIPSTDALVKKLTIFDKELQGKVQEINKLTTMLGLKSQELKQMQQEYDTLSTQVMENITEMDDLNKELENVKDANTKLTVKYYDLEKLLLESKEDSQNGVDCSQCQIKEEIINSLKNAKLHSKFNRSLSDSDTSSRFNKICTLQNELHAGREDCKELTEDVATIKNHLDRSNLSLAQNMDLDESMGESNIFNFTKYLDISNSTQERHSDMYSVEKLDCINYFVEKTGADKENLDSNVKIIDIMKMFYNSFIMQHSNEVENLVNKIKCYEESRNQLEAHVNKLSNEYSKVSKKLEEKEHNFQTVGNVLSRIRENTTLIKQEVANFSDAEKNAKFADVFKKQFLEILDNELGMSSVFIFENLIDSLVLKHQEDLSKIMNQYTELQKKLEGVTAELKSVEENLLQMKSQLTEKENEYNLLKAQKEKIHEINNALTLDIIKKEKDLSQTVMSGWKKLVENNIMCTSDIDMTMPLNQNITVLFGRLINKIRNQSPEIEKEKEQLTLEIKKSKTELEENQKAQEILKAENEKLKDIGRKVTLDLIAQNSLHTDLNKKYLSVVEENKSNVAIVDKMSKEIETLKETLIEKETTALNMIRDKNAKELLEKEAQIISLLATVKSYKEEINTLRSVNAVIVKEKESSDLELQRSKELLRINTIELDRVTADIIVLRESVKESSSVIETLKTEAKSLLQQNLQLKEQFDLKCKDCSRLEMNIKTHEKTVEIQSKMIMRLQKQKEEDDKSVTDKDTQLEELTRQISELQREQDIMTNIIKANREEFDDLKKAKEALEVQLSELERVGVPAPRLSDAGDATRRRRQSIHDSKRMFSEKQDFGDHNKVEAIFDSRPKPVDLFMEVDDDSSNRSTPLRNSRGRDSLQSRHEQSEEPPSRPSSVAEARRRRQSIHDLHRSVPQTPSPHERLSTRLGELTNGKSPDIENNNVQSEVKQLRSRLSTCQQELEELKERYRELDDECETCAQYLRERDAQCARLKKEKAALEVLVTDLKDKLQSVNPNRSQQEQKTIMCHAAVNTDEDWANLHSVVVDRMSFDAEVEKNKRLAKTVEELRFKKQDLKVTLGKMQKALERSAARDHSKALEMTKLELRSCKQELEQLKEKYRELDEECETCSEYLRERDEQCRRLKEAKAALEAKLEEYAEGSPGARALRRRRQGQHDRGRARADAAAAAGHDFLSYQVERDDNSKRSDEDKDRELKQLKLTVEKLSQQPPAAPLVVATGSAIVQNQQLSDVMKENQKLKKMNTKLIQICKKRGKKPDVTTEDLSEHILG